MLRPLLKTVHEPTVERRPIYRPTWLEIDLHALSHNTRIIAGRAHPAKLLAVLKADAYGHGAINIAKTALFNGASWLGVATVGEAVILRQTGITAPILVLGYLPDWQAEDALYYDIRATVFSQNVLLAFNETAKNHRTTAKIHVKVDTGMGRLGLLPHELIPFMKLAAELPAVEVEGLFTHFGQADETDLRPSYEQLACFQDLIQELEALNLRPPIVHAANTAAILNIPESHFDMVRSGIGLYGIDPAPSTSLPNGTMPVLQFKTSIAQVKTLPPNSAVGYGGAYHTKTHEQIAIIPVGYADGFRRTPQAWGEVLVRGKRAPLVGRVSMDQAAIQVSHIKGVQQGDEVVLIGRQGNETISADDVARQLGTISYEVVSEILARVPRLSEYIS